MRLILRRGGKLPDPHSIWRRSSKGRRDPASTMAPARVTDSARVTKSPRRRCFLMRRDVTDFERISERVYQRRKPKMAQKHKVLGVAVVRQDDLIFGDYCILVRSKMSVGMVKDWRTGVGCFLGQYRYPKSCYWLAVSGHQQKLSRRHVLLKGKTGKGSIA